MKKNQKDEGQLIQEAKQGSRQAFDELTKRHEKKIKKLLERYLANKEEASDLTQETFLKAYSALKNFQEDSAFYTWLYRVAVNTAKNYISHHPLRNTHDSINEISQDSHTPSALVEFNTPEYLALCDEVENMFSHFLEDMPADIRETLLLREIDNLSYADIAKQMHCPLGTVRSRIFRGRELLMAKLRE